ncbi:MAG: hypothetical protein KC621_13585 [Myxococcales bacterium]|nr:hypothetical protein [Myxococcales bacterium]
MATDDLSKLTGEWYRQWESSVSKWWDTVLEDPTFVKGMGDNLAQNARARSRWEESVDQSMEAMHLPTKKDIVRVARIASLLEDRVVAVEDRVLALGDQLDRIEKETLRARVDSAEALLALGDRLAAIEAKLDALTSAPAADDKPATTRRARKES